MSLKSLRRALLCAAVGSTMLVASPTSAATPTPTNIMFIGDSITEGLCGAYETFRDDALNKLDADGYLVDAVGARNAKPGTCFAHPDNDHQGWAGWSADMVHAALPADLLLVAKPDVALVALGTNDIFYSQSDASTMIDLANVVGDLRARNPKVAIILAKIADVQGVSSASFNAQVATLAASLSTATSPVSLVDFNTGIGAAQLNADLIHPNAVGAAILGNRAAAAMAATGRLSIAPAFGPYYDAEGFAQQTFVDFQGRAPNANELGSMLATISGSASNVGKVVAAQVNTSPQYTHRHAITRMYKAYFKRTPDIGGFDYWNDRMIAGEASVPELSYLFSTSDEFVLTYGSLTDAQFINLVYVNVLGRQAEAEGYAYWLGLMNSGQVTAPTSWSTSASRLKNINTTSRRFVDTVLVYYGMLDRMPTRQNCQPHRRFLSPSRRKSSTAPNTAFGLRRKGRPVHTNATTFRSSDKLHICDLPGGTGVSSVGLTKV
ncbi:MAG: DUF4214 domain-containing protein [Acidimicrobiales bacterium]